MEFLGIIVAWEENKLLEEKDEFTHVREAAVERFPSSGEEISSKNWRHPGKKESAWNPIIPRESPN